MKRLLPLLFVSLVAASCQEGPTIVSYGGLPSETTPATPSAPEFWTLSGWGFAPSTNSCWNDFIVLGYPLTVQRTADAVRLIGHWGPTDGIEYAGALQGREFSLSQTHGSFQLECGRGDRIEVTLKARVSGTFSGDGRSITADEVHSYLVVGSGEQIDVRYSWKAIAPER